MAESASNDDLEKEIERLTKDVKSSQRDLRDLTSGIRLAQEAFSQYQQAQAQMTSAINQLKSPLLSSIATLIKDHKVANQRITLEEQKLVMLKQEQTVLARQKDLKLAEIKATEQRIKSITDGTTKEQVERAKEIAAKREEHLATESKIQAIKNDIADGRGGANTAKIPEIDQLQSKKLETSTEIGTLGVYLNDLKTKGAEKLAGSEFIGDEFRSALGEANKEVGGNLILAAMLKEVTLIRKVVEGRISFEKKAGMSGGYRDTRTGQFVSEAKAGESGALSSAKTALAEEVRLSEIERVTKELEDQANTLESLTNQQKQLRDSTLAEAQQALEDQTKAVKDLEKAEIDFKDSALKKLEKTLEEQTESSDDLTKKQQNLADKVKMQEASITSEKWQKWSKTLGNVAEVLNKAIGPILELQKQFGIAAGTAAKLKFGNLKASIESTINSLRTGGPSVSTAEIEAAQTSFQGEFGGVLTPEAARGIAEEAKTLGVSAGELAKARRVFMTQTMGDTGKAKAAQDKFIGEFAKKGLTSKDAMEAIGKYSELLARNGSRFSTSFARAAADAKKIGVDLAKVDQVGDNIIGNFEGFLEGQAELGAMGFNLDSMKLAQIAETGDTGALFNELRSQLAATGKDITKLRRSEQLALSESFGISMEEMQRLAGPTAGSGEETLAPEELQKDANKSLTKLVFVAGTIAAILTTISGLVGTIAARMNFGAARNVLSNVSGRGGFVSSLLGRGTPGTPQAPGAPGAAGSPAPTSPGGAPGGVASSFINKLSPAKMLAGAGALLILSGALWITSKALQEFGKVEWASMAKAGVALLGLVGVVAALGAIMMSGIGAVAILAGAAALLIVSVSLMALGKAIQMTAAGMNEFVPVMGSLGTALKDFPIARLAGFGAAALVAAPGMLALSAAGAAVGMAKKVGNKVGSFLGITPAAPEAPSTAGVQSTAAAGAAGAENTSTQPTTPTVNVDFTRLEAKLDGVIRAIGSMKVEMDGNSVGKVLASNESRVSTYGPIRAQRA